MQLDPDFLEKIISEKLEFFFENKNMPEFFNYLQFSQKMKLNPKDYIELVQKEYLRGVFLRKRQVGVKKSRSYMY